MASPTPLCPLSNCGEKDEMPTPDFRSHHGLNLSPGISQGLAEGALLTQSERRLVLSRLAINRKDYNRKYVVALLATMVMHPWGWTKAATLTGVAGNAPPAHTSILESIDCGLPGGACPWGRKRACGPGFCWCAPCGRFWSLWHRYVIPEDQSPPKPRS